MSPSSQVQNSARVCMCNHFKDVQLKNEVGNFCSKNCYFVRFSNTTLFDTI